MIKIAQKKVTDERKRQNKDRLQVVPSLFQKMLWCLNALMERRPCSWKMLGVSVATNADVRVLKLPKLCQYMRGGLSTWSVCCMYSRHPCSLASTWI